MLISRSKLFIFIGLMGVFGSIGLGIYHKITDVKTSDKSTQTENTDDNKSNE